METSPPIGGMKSFHKIQPDNVQENEPEDIALYELHDSRGWKVLKEFIQQYIDNLDRNLNIEDSDTVEDIGFKFLAVSTTKAYLQSVIDAVETSYDVIKEQEEESEN